MNPVKKIPYSGVLVAKMAALNDNEAALRLLRADRELLEQKIAAAQARSAELRDAIKLEMNREQDRFEQEIVLRHDAGMSVPDIADSFGCSEGVVRTAIHRWRRSHGLPHVTTSERPDRRKLASHTARRPLRNGESAQAAGDAGAAPADAASDSAFTISENDLAALASTGSSATPAHSPRTLHR